MRRRTDDEEAGAHPTIAHQGPRRGWQADGREHTTIPTLGFIAGKAGGAIRGAGTYIVGNSSSSNDLYVGLARAYGVNISTFGEARFSTSPLSLG